MKLKEYINPPSEWFKFPQFESPGAGLTQLLFVGAAVSHFNYPEYQWYWIIAGVGWGIISCFIQGEDGEANKD